MTPLSHTTHTTSAAPEQTGDHVRPPVADLTNLVLIHHLFPYLGPSDLHHVGQACRRFRDASRRVWQRRAQETCRACAELLPSFGITPPAAEPTPEEASAFLNRTVQRVKQINYYLPEGLQSQFSEKDLVCKVGPGHMQEFLQKAYDHSLRTLFRKLAHVPEDASPERSVRLIREWLQTAETGEIQRLLISLPNEIEQLLVCLPREIERLTTLQRLALDHNRFTSLPPEIGRLTALQQLHLRNNRLTALPPEIGRLSALERLYLNDNQLDSLPPEIGQLRALRSLDLGDNRLMSLPPEIGRLSALERLYLNDNQLDSLPPEIGQLRALRSLDLGGNSLMSIPPEIGQLSALRTLSVHENQLASLPPEIGQLTALEVHTDPIFPAGEEGRLSTVLADVIAAIQQVRAQMWQALL